jgi:hypothetical protein
MFNQGRVDFQLACLTGDMARIILTMPLVELSDYE